MQMQVDPLHLVAAGVAVLTILITWLCWPRTAKEISFSIRRCDEIEEVLKDRIKENGEDGATVGEFLDVVQKKRELMGL